MVGRISAFLRQNEYLVFIAPPVIYVLSLTLYPALYSVFISFTNINLGFSNWSFVGLENYSRFFALEYSNTVLINTLLVVSCVSVLQIALGFAIALLLNHNWPARAFVRSVAVLPWVVPSIVIALLFRQLFNGSSLGLANALLAQLGFPPHVWLADPNSALAIIIGVMTWRGLPLSTIILLGGLQTIPRELYEASGVDGATPAQAFRLITLPLMKPILMINLIWVTAGNLNHLDTPYGLTGGGPSHQTAVLSVTLYDNAFVLLDAGLGAAIATVMLALNLIMTVAYLYLLRSRH